MIYKHPDKHPDIEAELVLYNMGKLDFTQLSERAWEHVLRTECSVVAQEIKLDVDITLISSYENFIEL